MNITHQAQEQFDRLGWPHRKLEGWQWSDFSRQMPNQMPDQMPGGIEAPVVQPDISSVEGVERRDKSLDLPDNIDALTALNIAQGGVGMEIKIQKDIAEPIHIHHRAGFSRLDIKVAQNARATIYEHISGDGFSHLLTELKLAPHAQLDHIRVFDQPESAITAARLNAELSASAHWNAAIIASGAKLQRIDHRFKFSGAQARAQCSAALIASGHAHCDIGMASDHHVADCQSISTLRAVLRDHAHGSFRGAADVAAGARGSDVQQLAKALLLSDDARFNAQPALGIYHDDVQCAHGIAVGALSADALFYLRTRAISEQQAKHMLITAFISDLFASLPAAEQIALQKLEMLL